MSTYSSPKYPTHPPQLHPPPNPASHPHNPYNAEWVATYSSPEYLRLPDMAESVLNHTGESVPYGGCLVGLFLERGG